MANKHDKYLTIMNCLISMFISSKEFKGFFFETENTLSGWLSIPNRSNIKKIGYWKSQYVIVSKRKILFYNSEAEKDNANPRMIIDLEFVF